MIVLDALQRIWRCAAELGQAAAPVAEVQSRSAFLETSFPKTKARPVGGAAPTTWIRAAPAERSGKLAVPCLPGILLAFHFDSVLLSCVLFDVPCSRNRRTPDGLLRSDPGGCAIPRPIKLTVEC